MTNEEAKRILLSAADFSGVGEKAQATAEALCVAIEALEKQIPKKPDVVLIGINYWIEQCPTCKGINLGMVCHTCGQKMDWSEE